MTVSDIRFVSTRFRVMICLIIMMVITGQPVNTLATDGARKDFKHILKSTIEDLWTGREFTPKLISQQELLKNMLKTGEIKKPVLEKLLKKTILAMLNRHQTSRYILKTMPERFNALFSPHMNWEEMKTILWQSLSSFIKKDDPFFIKVGTMAPPGTPWLNIPETEIIPSIKQLSGGKVRIQIYGGGVMGEDTEILDKVNDGRLTCCGCTALGVLSACPEASALLLPGLFNNYEEVDYIFEKFRGRLDEAFQKKGYDLWALIHTGFFYMFSSKAITGLTDIGSLRVLAWFGSMETSLFEELGITAKHVSLIDIISILSSDQGDAFLAPTAWTLGMQAYQHTNYYVKPALLYSPAAIIVPTNLKDRLQKQTGVTGASAHNILEVIVSEIQSFEPEWRRQIRIYETKSLKAFEAKCGIQAITLSSEEHQIIEKAGRTVQQKLTGNVFSKDLIGAIQKALAEYRTTH